VKGVEALKGYFTKRRLSGGCRKRLPVLRQDDCIDRMSVTACRDEFALRDGHPVDVHSRGRNHRLQCAALKSHHVTGLQGAHRGDSPAG